MWTPRCGVQKPHRKLSKRSGLFDIFPRIKNTSSTIHDKKRFLSDCLHSHKTWKQDPYTHTHDPSTWILDNKGKQPHKKTVTQTESTTVGYAHTTTNHIIKMNSNTPEPPKTLQSTTRPSDVRKFIDSSTLGNSAIDTQIRPGLTGSEGSSIFSTHRPVTLAVGNLHIDALQGCLQLSPVVSAYATIQHAWVTNA